MANDFNINQYLKEGYFDSEGYRRKEIYIDWAKEIANKLSNSNMTTASLRKFYNQIKGLQHLLTNEENFNANKYRLYNIIPLAQYKLNSSVPQEFVDFLEVNLQQVEKDFKNFQVFVDHFQSVVAYFKESSNKSRR